ncbi:MAG: MgtC/SapB family protein [Rhodothermales bacterium]|nr:MgtC/SapB family protein [Rhodothermales bacterium]
MDILLEELTGGLPDWTQFTRFVIRLVAAMLLGAIVGYERERAGKAAGLRTHMLVAMGSTLLIISCAAAELSVDGISRAVQGIITGIGFIGAGAILKRSDEGEIEGLTTAAGIFMTAATGVAVGLGLIGLALLSVLMTWVVLGVLGIVSARISMKNATSADDAKR